MRLCLLFVAVLIMAGKASSQATITPSSPTQQDLIVVRFSRPVLACLSTTQTVISANVVRTDLIHTGCVLGPGPVVVPFEVTLGRLAPGVYTYEIYEQYSPDPATLISIQTIVVSVAVAPIPTVERWGLLALAGCLTAVGLVAVRAR
jgi:hypothetical protein